MSSQFVDPVYIEIALRLLAALLIGGVIGLERSYHARPAGFRTHVLVCLSTALLMLMPVYEDRWFPESSDGRIALDPTRMAQGIMTGIGFLGAGTIMKEGLAVRGLTTAASIWITAAIGVLLGVGFYVPALLASLLTLGSLSVFRWLEQRMPAQFYADCYVRFAPDAAPDETRIRKLLAAHGFSISKLSQRLDGAAAFFEYRMVIRASGADDACRLSQELLRAPAVKAFEISPVPT